MDILNKTNVVLKREAKFHIKRGQAQCLTPFYMPFSPLATLVFT